jgi:hypothetical protein
MGILYFILGIITGIHFILGIITGLLISIDRHRIITISKERINKVFPQKAQFIESRSSKEKFEDAKNIDDLLN